MNFEFQFRKSKPNSKIRNNNNNTCNILLHVLLYAQNFLLEHNMLKITMESDSPYRKTYIYTYTVCIYLLYILKKKVTRGGGGGARDLKKNFFSYVNTYGHCLFPLLALIFLDKKVKNTLGSLSKLSLC